MFLILSLLFVLLPGVLCQNGTNNTSPTPTPSPSPSPLPSPSPSFSPSPSPSPSLSPTPPPSPTPLPTLPPLVPGGGYRVVYVEAAGAFSWSLVDGDSRAVLAMAHGNNFYYDDVAEAVTAVGFVNASVQTGNFSRGSDGFVYVIGPSGARMGKSVQPVADGQAFFARFVEQLRSSSRNPTIAVPPQPSVQPTPSKKPHPVPISPLPPAPLGSMSPSATVRPGYEAGTRSRVAISTGLAVIFACFGVGLIASFMFVYRRNRYLPKNKTQADPMGYKHLN
jgi:hypothetical protein